MGKMWRATIVASACGGALLYGLAARMPSTPTMTAC